MLKKLSGTILALTLLTAGGARAMDYDPNDLPSVSGLETRAAMRDFNSDLIRVTPMNVRELIYPRFGATHQYVVIEVCRSSDPSCIDERQMMAVAAEKSHNGTLLRPGHDNDVAFYWLDPDDQVFQDLAALCKSEGAKLKGPPGPPGLAVCFNLNERFSNWTGHAYVFYKLDGPFGNHSTMMYGQQASRWKDEPYLLWNIREWAAQ